MGVEDPEVTMASLFDTVESAISDQDIIEKLLDKAKADVDKKEGDAKDVGETMGEFLTMGILRAFEEEDFVNSVQGRFNTLAANAFNRLNWNSGFRGGGYEEHE
jgi:hypothetical protein